MKDIKKIQEFFSKPLGEVKKDESGNHLEPQFKKGDKVTYLGNPGEITGVNKEMTGAYSYNVSYDKGNGKTKASNISNKNGTDIKLAEAMSKFADYSNNELAAYARELSKQRADAASKGQSDLLSGINKEIEAATRELKKRSQALKGLTRTDVNEQADHVAPMVVKAYKEYLEAKKEGGGEKEYRYYSKKLNNTYSTRADRDAIEAILKKKYGSALEESVNEAQFKDLQIGDEFLRFGENGQLWKKTSEKQAEFIKNVGKKTAKYNKPAGSLNVFPSTMGVTLYKSTNESVNEQEEDAIDTITMDVPLFIRVLEYAREDAQADMDLHDLAEKAIAGTKQQGLLQMDDYDMLVGELEQLTEAYSGFLRNPEDPDSEPFNPTGAVAEFREELRALFGKFKGDLKNPEFIKGVAEIMVNWKSLLRSQMDETTLTEAYVPQNIAEFAKRKGVSSLVRKVAGWAEKVGARITGGTAIGKYYDTLILDMGYQTSDIRIDCEDETIELYDEPIYSFADFKRVFMEEESRKQAEHDEETLRREQGLEENKPVANPNKHIKGIQIQLDQLGVKYEMDPKNKVQPFKVIYKPVNKDDRWYDNFDDLMFRYNLKGVVKTSLKETAAYIAETIKLGQQLNEELCPKGKAYIKKRMAAGEKSSAYLSGRAVKVCKGQMKG